MRARLVITRGEATPSALDLDPDRRITLGRSRDNTIVLHDEHASRLHAQVYNLQGKWFIRDCGTRNHTYVNSARVQDETPLQDGQEIGIADMRLRFMLLDDAGRPVPPSPPSQVRETPPGGNGQSGQPDSGHTTLLADELAALHEFMASAVEETDPAEVIRRALATLAKHTRATVTGF